MATIKKSYLKEVFLKHGLNEGIFDIFNRKRNKLAKDLKDIRSNIEDIIDKAPTKQDKKNLRNLRAAILAAHAAGVNVY
jgi:CO dehydrogenase/acetyl-CoA synthase delta subunit